MEVWRVIFVDYLVSNLGNVDSLKNGKRKRLKQNIGRGGYACVALYVDGKQKDFYVHRLVAMAFIPNPQNLPQVNHKNGIRNDNRVENLEWTTPSENIQHAYDTGLAKSGENHYYAKLTDEQVRYIRNNPDNLNQDQLAEKFGIVLTTLSMIQLGRYRKNAGGAIRGNHPAGKPRVPDDERVQIRAEYQKGGMSQRALARKFGRSPGTIKRIVNDK